MNIKKDIKIFGFKDVCLYWFFRIINFIISIPLEIISVISWILKKLSDLLNMLPSESKYIPQSINKRLHLKAKIYKSHNKEY